MNRIPRRIGDTAVHHLPLPVDRRLHHGLRLHTVHLRRNALRLLLRLYHRCSPEQPERRKPRRKRDGWRLS